MTDTMINLYERCYRTLYFGSDDPTPAFDRACAEVFGATMDDLSDADLDRLERLQWGRQEMIAYCREHGYDLMVQRYNITVQYYEQFALMVRAKVEGLLPRTPEEKEARHAANERERMDRSLEEEAKRMERRLAEEAEQFKATKGARRR